MTEERLSQLEQENQDLLDQNFELSSKIRTLSVELEAYRRDANKSAERLLNADKEADAINKATAYKYMLELKSIKLLAQKYRAYYGEEMDKNKAEASKWLIDCLTGLDAEGSFKVKDVAQKIEQKLSDDGKIVSNDKPISKEFEDFINSTDRKDLPTFDLDEAVNPTTPLDLSELLKELGI